MQAVDGSGATRRWKEGRRAQANAVLGYHLRAAPGPTLCELVCWSWLLHSWLVVHVWLIDQLGVY